MTTIVEGSGGAGSKYIKTSYPEQDLEDKVLRPEVSLVSNTMKVGIDL